MDWTCCGWGGPMGYCVLTGGTMLMWPNGLTSKQGWCNWACIKIIAGPMGHYIGRLGSSMSLRPNSWGNNIFIFWGPMGLQQDLAEGLYAKNRPFQAQWVIVGWPSGPVGLLNGHMLGRCTIRMGFWHDYSLALWALAYQLTWFS